jgi:hypothetical protein
MRIIFNDKMFKKDMKNLIDYSVGYIDGIEKGKKEFLNNLGKVTIEALGQYIDVNARMNTQALHHVYEWYQTGSPQARLFDLNYTVSNLGLSVNSKFKQSNSISRDSSEPFYNKARIMEEGVPVTINPKSGGALRFEEGGQEIFTKKSITVFNPGGQAVEGSYEKTFDDFMLRYFKQSFLKACGIYDYINKPTLYKKNLAKGVKGGGKSTGYSTGYKWIANAAVGVDING